MNIRSTQLVKSSVGLLALFMSFKVVNPSFAVVALIAATAFVLDTVRSSVIHLAAGEAHAEGRDAKRIAIKAVLNGPVEAFVAVSSSVVAFAVLGEVFATMTVTVLLAFAVCNHIACGKFLSTTSWPFGAQVVLTVVMVSFAALTGLFVPYMLLRSAALIGFALNKAATSNRSRTSVTV